MVLVRKWCAEEGHDPVAHHLVHEAFEAMDGLHHMLEHRIEDHPSLFRIAIGEQLHRSFEIREQDGDQLALALERYRGRHDALDEVLRRVQLWGAEPRRGASGQSGSALIAEHRPRAILGAAPRTEVRCHVAIVVRSAREV
jgi:hypothetical protein